MNPTTRLVLLLFLLFPALAAGVDLYSARVPMGEETPQARQQAMAQALRQVLVKASGRKLPARSGKLGKALARAEEMVQEFRYVTAPAGAGQEAPVKWLRARFDRKAVARLLRELGMAPWEGPRPELILWLALDEKGRRHLADPERENALLEAARSAARERGIELVLPLMDLQDRNALKAGDLWTGNLEGIRQASARYGRAVPLAGRLKRSGGKWRGHWLLLLPDGEKEFDRSGATGEVAVRSGVRRALDLLVSRYLPVADGGESSPVRLRVLGVRDLAQYSRLVELLHSLGPVVSFRPLEMEGDRLLFEVRVRGGREALASRLALEAGLRPVVDIPEEEEGAVSPETLSYSLQ